MEFNRRAESPVRTVSRFVTQVWEHPLLDETTRKKRKELLGMCQANLASNSMFAKNIIGVPVGSFRSIMDDDSDIDIIYLMKPAFFYEYRAVSQAVESFNRLDRHHYSISAANITSYPREKNAGSALLITPDDYIVGNLEIAQKMRLRILEDLVKFPEGWESVSSYLNYYIRNWRSILSPDGLDPEKRQKRFEKNLSDRSSQSSNSEAWKSGFLRSLDNLGLPSIDVYSWALELTNGSIALDTRYAANGIRP